ncbi:MAG: hypothetical protein H7A45_13355, partial [Verrucomicrobiales bacterium]|nr:hypothetical protein [Verrucomicrobiales bacterium]
MFESVIAGIASGGLTGAAVVWLAKSILSERIKNSIKHEYDIRLEVHRSSLKSELDRQIEVFRSQLKTQESVAQAKWDIKRDSCLNALNIVDACWANLDWSGTDARGKQIDPAAIEKQSPPSIEEIRSCYNSLALVL